MGQAESSSGGCDASPTTCMSDGNSGRSSNGFTVAHDGAAFTIAGGPSGFSVSGGPYADAHTDSTAVDSGAYVHNMAADARAPVTESTHHGSFMVSMASDVLRGDGPACSEMRAEAGHFHSHTHDPQPLRSITITRRD